MASIRSVPRHDGGEAFEVRWRVDGEFHQRTVPTYPEAEQYVAELTRQRVGQPAVHAADGPVRFDVIAEASLQTAAINLKPRTVESYRESLLNHTYPAFGARLITNITPSDVEDWILSLIRAGLAPSSVHNHFAVTIAFGGSRRVGCRWRGPGQGRGLPSRSWRSTKSHVRGHY